MKGIMNHCIVINLHFENNVENRICHCVELEIVKAVNFQVLVLLNSIAILIYKITNSHIDFILVFLRHMMLNFFNNDF